MSKVFPLQDMKHGSGRMLRAAVGWSQDDPFVKEHRHLFTEPEEDPKDAEIAALKAQLAELQPKPTPKKAG